MRYGLILAVLLVPSLASAQQTIVQRAITILRTLEPADRTPSGAELKKFAENMTLAQPQLWTQLITSKGYVVNPAATGVEAQLDVGTLAGETFTPATVAQDNDLLATYVVRFTRQIVLSQARIGGNLRATVPAAGVSLQEAQAAVSAAVKTEVETIVGTETDD